MWVYGEMVLYYVEGVGGRRVLKRCKRRWMKLIKVARWVFSCGFVWYVAEFTVVLDGAVVVVCLVLFEEKKVDEWDRRRVVVKWLKCGGGSQW